jgi:hypothetical protein
MNANAAPAAMPAYDLGAMLKADQRFCRILMTHQADIQYLGLRLQARIGIHRLHFGQNVVIDCSTVKDFAIRPPHPAIIEGGPFIEFFEDHPLLQNIGQTVPNTDGMKYFHPPVKFTMLKIDQSHVIAQRFVLLMDHDDPFKNSVGFNDQQKQHDRDAKKQAIDWMEKFRLPDTARRHRAQYREVDP